MNWQQEITKTHGRIKIHNTNIGCSSKLVTDCTKVELHNYVCC